MPPRKASFENVSSLLRDQVQRFVTRYTRGLEGVFTPTGDKVYVWTAQFKVTAKEEVEDLLRRLEFYVSSGVRTLPVVDYGVDRRGVPFLITQWKKVEPVALVARQHHSPAALFSQMVSQIAKLHTGGMPFGDIAPDSFLLDAMDRVHLCGIPAFGYPVPPTSEQALNYVAPEPLSKEKVPFEQDIYALGVYAHQLFTRRPFPKVASQKQLEEHLELQTPALLSLYQDTPEWASEVLAGTLRWNPEDRISMKELSALAQAELSASHRLSLFLTSLRNFELPEFSVSGLSLSSIGLSHRAVVTTCLLLLFVLVGVYFGLPNLHLSTPPDEPIAVAHLNPVDGTSNLKGAFGTEGASSTENIFNYKEESLPAADVGKKLNILGSPGSGNESFSTTTETAVTNIFTEYARASREAEETARARSASGGAASEAPNTKNRNTAVEHVSTSKQGNELRLSVLNAVPERELLALLRRGKSLPPDQLQTAGRELLVRGHLRVSQKLALLTMMRYDPKTLPPELFDGLLAVLDDHVRITHLPAFAAWGRQETELLLSAIAVQSWSPEVTYASFMALASADLQTEPLRSLITKVKSEHWDITITEMKAIACAALGPLADPDAAAAAIQKLEGRISPLETLLLLSGSLPPLDDAPWCPSFEVTGI